MEELSPGTSIKVEEHEGQVTWYAPIELTAGVDPKTLEIRGTIHMQVCQTHGICEPVKKDFVAKQAAPPMRPTICPSPSANPQSAIQNPQSEAGPFQLNDLGRQARRSNRSINRPSRRIGRA